VLGTFLAAVALLITLGVLLSQSLYVRSAAREGQRVQLPLPTWPVSEKLLWIALLLAVAGVIAGFSGWRQLARGKGKFAGGRWVAQAILAGAACFGLALACYLMGSGLIFVG